MSGVSMTRSDSSKSYRIFYLRESTIDPDSVPYEFHMEDNRYFSDCLAYSETSKDFEALVNQNTLVYKDLEDCSSISHAFKITFPKTC